MKKYVIYTSLTGGYDNLIQLTCVSEEFDYVCFTDSCIGESKNGIWTLKKIPDCVDDKQRLSRYPKMHPHVLLADYEYSVYIDASVDIINYELYEIFKDKINRGVILSGVKHPSRDCAYDEFFIVYKLRKENNLSILKKEFKFLKKEGFPSHFGMFEAGMILRKHTDVRVISECERWWLIYNLYSKRDQLCYTYTLWKSNIPIDFLENVGLTVPNSYCRLVNHSNILHGNSLYARIKKRFYILFRKHEALMRVLFMFYLEK